MSRGSEYFEGLGDDISDGEIASLRLDRESVMFHLLVLAKSSGRIARDLAAYPGEEGPRAARQWRRDAILLRRAVELLRESTSGVSLE
jgi:hypothetical protein